MKREAEAGARPFFGSHCDPSLARAGGCRLASAGPMGTVGTMKKKIASTQVAEAAVAAHYGLLLGIKSPWQVKRVDLKLDIQRVDAEVEHDPSATVACPACGRHKRRTDPLTPV